MSEGDYLRRAYSLSVWLWGVGCVASFLLQGWQAMAGWTVGCALSAAVVGSLEMAIRRHFVPGNLQAKRNLLRVYAAKVPIILVFLVMAVLAGRGSLPFIAGLGAGIILVQTAIVLRTAALVIAEYARDRR
jgi:hypothetical protein